MDGQTREGSGRVSEKKPESKLSEIILFIVVFAMALAFYMIPVNGLPFGDVDASTHFGLGDNVGQNGDFSLNVPYYLNFTYGFANDGKMWYHPLMPYMIGISQMVSGSRIIAPFVLFALLSCLFIPFTVLLTKRLFGLWPAVMTVPLLLYSVRDFTTYAWGLWPERASWSLIPIILLLAYSYFDKKSLWKPIVIGVLLGIQGSFHIQGVMMTIPIILLYAGYLWIKDKKLPFKWVDVAVPACLMILILLPSFSGLFNYNKNMNNQDHLHLQEFGTLLNWYPENIPYAPWVSDTTITYYHLPYYLIIICVAFFFLLGLKDLKTRDGTVLYGLWLFTLYCMMHLNVIGFSARIHRFVNSEGMIILSIMGIVAYLIVDMPAKKWKDISFFKYAKIAIPVMLLVLLGFGAVTVARNTYPDEVRVNEYQLDACEWVRTNTAEDIHLRLIGTPIYYERKWIQVLCQRQSVYDDTTIDGWDSEYINLTTHIFFDKTISLYTNRSMRINATGLNKIYENPYVEVYEYENNIAS